METLRVTRTLVVGLGSTGTRICDQVADRIRWELGDLRRAPWVRFLSIETDANQESQLHQTGDFRTLTLNATEFAQILGDAEAYDEKIALTSWWDEDTIRKLPDRDVVGGAGNIRMVGRLAFLYERNYSSIKAATVERLDALRTLTENDATEQRGPLPDGTNPPVVFAEGAGIRIVVLGTLCGGTCSGIVSDFGYFLRLIVREEEKIVGVFSLPRPDLVAAINNRAERFKKNAFHALKELNHYCLAGRDTEPPIKFPDKEADTTRNPYDLLYLVMPRQLGPTGENELNRALGDRVFLNTIAPLIDPFARSADAPRFDLEHRAHAFSTFGLATVEFPVQQVMEACSKRLLAHALRQWNNRSLDSAEEAARLNQIGLTEASIAESLRRMSSGDNITHRLQSKKAEIVQFATSNIDEAERSLEELRAAFSRPFGSQSTGALPPGIVPHTFQVNREHAAFAVLDRLRGHVEAHILDYSEGPAPLRQLLVRAFQRIAELQGLNPATHTAEVERVDSLLRLLHGYHRSKLLGFVGLKKPAIGRTIPLLREAIEAEIRAKESIEIHRALQSGRSRGSTEPGTLERLSRLLRPVQARVDKLSDRITALIHGLNRRADELARTTPAMNGVCVFDPETATGGTVRAEFQRCLVEEAGEAARDWKEVREELASEIVRSWEGLPPSIVPRDVAKGDDDWILRDFDPLGMSGLIPQLHLDSLETKARVPFLRLRGIDVLTRWAGEDGTRSLSPINVREAAQLARPFLEISRDLAERGGRSPIVTQAAILAPASHRRDEFVSHARTSFGSIQVTDESPDPYRAILLEEWYRFPLSGAPDVLGTQGLHTAICNDFPTFHTRTDVSWTGLSDKEVADLRAAEELLTLSVLLGIMEPKEGALVIPWARTGPGDIDERRLPLDVGAAAQTLALSPEGEKINPNDAPRDLNNRPLVNARAILRERVEERRRKSEGSPRARDKEFIEFLDKQLANGVGGAIPGWNKRDAEDHIIRYCGRNPDLLKAFIDQFGPDEAVVASLWRNAGDKNPYGGEYREEGYYCSTCGGLIGRTFEEATQNAWRCKVNPNHYFGPEQLIRTAR